MGKTKQQQRGLEMAKWRCKSRFFAAFFLVSMPGSNPSWPLLSERRNMEGARTFAACRGCVAACRVCFWPKPVLSQVKRRRER